jgi:hypothetical protein
MLFMEYHFLLNGQSVEIETYKPISDQLREIFVTDVRNAIGDSKDNLQAMVMAAWKAFITNLPDS